MVCWDVHPSLYIGLGVKELPIVETVDSCKIKERAT